MSEKNLIDYLNKSNIYFDYSTDKKDLIIELADKTGDDYELMMQLEEFFTSQGWEEEREFSWITEFEEEDEEGNIETEQTRTYFIDLKLVKIIELEKKLQLELPYDKVEQKKYKL